MRGRKGVRQVNMALIVWATHVIQRKTQLKQKREF